jgi:uncharacterized protein YjbI with pentapeptide repeats
MSNKEHLKILKQGVAVWNQWRRDNPRIIPELEGLDIERARDGNEDFVGTYVDERKFIRVNFAGIDLSHARLSNAKLNFADLTASNLSKASLFDVGLNMAMLAGANLHSAFAMGADCRSADFTEADLSSSNCKGATFRGAKLLRADLSAADFFTVNVGGADLTNAILHHTTIGLVDFSGATLDGTQFHDAITVGTIWGDVDLSVAVGLDEIAHAGPSIVGLPTIFRSGGKIPESFLRGCGVPDSFIAQIPALVSGAQPIQFYSCFISYSSKDEDFARRLHARMRQEGLRVWFAPEDMKGGDYFSDQIDRAIQMHDRLLLVLSENSIASNWVIREIKRTRKVEEREGRKKLFPISLTDYEVLRSWECLDHDSGLDLAEEIRKFHIPDFSNWKSHDHFEKAFARLYADLKASTV